MSKSTRNIVITVAVIVVVAVAALPFVLKALKKPETTPVDTSISETAEATDEFTYPEEITADELITDILSTMENVEQDAEEQQTTQQTQQTQQAQTTVPTTVKGTENGTTATTKPTTTKKNESTTKKTETTTKKNESTTASSGDNIVTSVSGMDALASGAVVSYLWNPEGNFYYVEDNPWQRNFGFNLIYDWGAAMVCMYYDTFRAQFNYDNTDWMIQAWKGQYGFLFIGGEIGVYTRDPGKTGSHYNCADDNHLINMEMSIYFDAHDGNGYKLMFTRAYYPHWWSTGFVDGHLADYKFNDRSCLIMVARLTMYDEVMRDTFAASLEGCGFRKVESRSEVSTSSSDTFTIVGNDIYFSWKNIDQGITTRG